MRTGISTTLKPSERKRLKVILKDRDAPQKHVWRTEIVLLSAEGLGMPGKAAWRSRHVQYYAGDWASIQTVLPEFDLKPFTAGPDEPPNPFLKTVMRKPLSAAERPLPVGVVSHTYSLASHRDVAGLCRSGVLVAGIEPDDLRYEVGLSELGEWMNFRIYFPDSYSFTDAALRMHMTVSWI
jgi:hypothetical protein